MYPEQVRAKELDVPDRFVFLRCCVVRDGDRRSAISGGETSGVIFNSILEKTPVPPGPAQS